MEEGSGDSSPHLSLSELKDMFLSDHGLGLSARPRRVSCQQSVSSLLLQDVISSSGAVLDYCYDTTEELWCQLTLKVPYSRKIWRGFKFGSLVVGIETAKLKSANIMLAAPAMRKT